MRISPLDGGLFAVAFFCLPLRRFSAVRSWPDVDFWLNIRLTACQSVVDIDVAVVDADVDFACRLAIRRLHGPHLVLGVVAERLRR